MGIRIIIAIVLFLGVLSWDLISDLNKWHNNYFPVNHFWEAVIRMGLLIPSTLLLAGFTPKFIPKKWLLNLFLSVLMLGAYWWFFFDGLYNSFRGFPWLFNGSVDGGDSVLDLFLMKLRDWQEATIKLGLIATTTYFYVRKVK